MVLSSERGPNGATTGARKGFSPGFFRYPIRATLLVARVMSEESRSVKGIQLEAIRVLLGSSTDIARASISRMPKQVVFASPYLTSPAAENTIGEADPASSIVLTSFAAEIFANKASSLGTLRALLERGFDLRYLDGLHAKVIATQDTCFVGSQNLTIGGMRNREATAIVSDASVVKAVNKDVRSWTDLSRPITQQMIDEMEKAVAPLANRAGEVVDLAKSIDAHAIVGVRSVVKKFASSFGFQDRANDCCLPDANKSFVCVVNIQKIVNRARKTHAVAN